MVKTKFKKAVSLVLAAVMSLTAFMGIGATTAFAAVGEKADVYLVDYPRSGDTNNNGEWGHGNLNYMNGWKGLSTKYTGLRAMGSYSGNIAYCIEPGTGQRTGDAETADDFTAYVERCKELSLYDTGVTTEYGDKLLTLSTCEYSRTNGRLVVVAKLINE